MTRPTSQRHKIHAILVKVITIGLTEGFGLDSPLKATDFSLSHKTKHYFSANYLQARTKFLEAAQAAGARVVQLPLGARGAKKQPMFIDIAWLGTKKPRKVLLHTSGLHGVEGFAGSAIQIALLNRPPSLSHDEALVLVHCLNPFGMDWLRRYNESNVDLNRNFLSTAQDWRGSPEAYERLNTFLNPPKLPSADFFLLRTMYYLLRLGPAAFRKAVAIGQHDYPKGLFFGGHQLEEGPSLYRSWLQEAFATSERLFVIDVHTGLGDFGQESLFHKIQDIPSPRLSQILDRPLPEDFPESSVVGYRFRGGHCDVFSELFPDQTVDFLTQEFGTYSKLKILKALRAENQYHHFGDGKAGHWSKQNLQEAFCPASATWRAEILSKGVELVHQVAAYLSANQQPGSKTIP